MDTALALRAQQQEINEHTIYSSLAAQAQGKNRKVLQQIANDEARHAAFWQKYTKQKVTPTKAYTWWHLFLARILGITFAIKLMERGEGISQKHYRKLTGIPGIKEIIADEERHEKALIDLLKDERLDYAGAIVLGLNDGLVELTGVLAGLTFALNNTRIIAVVALVTGLAAAMSMAASGYFSSREEGRNPLRSAIYTGVAYVIVVMLLVTPFLLLHTAVYALLIALITAILIIAGYSFFISVAKDQSFKHRFWEMIIVSMTVAAISFGIGLFLNRAFGISA